MCIYYLISFTKSIYFLLNFQIPFMFWIIILPLNILYYPTKESIRFSNNLIFLTVLRFIVISATFWAGFGELFWGFLQFQLLFLGFLAEFGELFWGFLQFQLLFAGFFRLFGLVYNIPKEIDIEFLRYPISRTLTIRNPLS